MNAPILIKLAGCDFSGFAEYDASYRQSTNFDPAECELEVNAVTIDRIRDATPWTHWLKCAISLDFTELTNAQQEEIIDQCWNHYHAQVAA